MTRHAAGADGQGTGRRPAGTRGQHAARLPTGAAGGPGTIHRPSGLLLPLILVWLLVPLALGAARWPRWWIWIAPELTPMTWVQSVVLVLAAAGSLLIAIVLRRTGPRHGPVWWLLSAGFLALAVDDRFALHERVRDGFLAPRGVTVPFLPWVAPGDFLIMAVAVVGLAMLPTVWRAVRPNRWSGYTLMVGVLLAVVAVGIDSINPETWTVAAERVQQTTEETIELGSTLAFLAAVALRLLGLLDAHVATTGDMTHEPTNASPVTE